ncbi:hypothetical protein JSQ81_10500 [Sporosarcina sp. Marseille-Q4063]|uniref:hypothetical protein n=1 Tax=Sporosarcina sp. Marseille-Q4063 TaxID=2810514 RepID=UPI001BAF90CA|nr:hypothetical protein [Sporosarcina sp. Marseille-Q4063]QUW20304.1 hypothetical protein JSQ81_10500 [Sporosarcina sp. Marseille-Q4063]
MKNARYDEFQLATRHKIAFQSFILVLILIGVNGYVKAGYGIWASPFLESFILVWIPSMYFAVMSIVKNAYFSKNDYPVLVAVVLGLAATMGFFSTVPFIFSEEFPFIENGQLSDRIMGLLIAIISVGMGVALIVRRALNRRMDRGGE